ncbi:hypothetical protein L6452_39739 [Arctium lappa]|uniref:Uncharacterized protein n=1 Tax=Arctium lappa TaxID=4217 RepID=A0ACB8XT47_ARCLA|nr:hypothetical protein L6452_39739 [Arctium lappa]
MSKSPPVLVVRTSQKASQFVLRRAEKKHNFLKRNRIKQFSKVSYVSCNIDGVLREDDSRPPVATSPSSRRYCLLSYEDLEEPTSTNILKSCPP